MQQPPQRREWRMRSTMKQRIPVRFPVPALVWLLGALFCAPTVAVATADDGTRALYAANGLLNRGLHDLALVEYNTFIEAHPDHDEIAIARYGRGVCLFRLARYEDAVSDLDDLGEDASFAFAPDVRLILGHCHLRLDEPEAAASQFASLAEDFSSHASAPEARVLLVESLYRAGASDQMQRAIRAALRSARTDAQRDRVQYYRGLHAIGDDRAEAAVDAFRSIIDRETPGELAPRARLLLAESLAAADASGEAMATFKSVIREGDDARMPRALYGMARVQYRESDVDGAAASLDSLLDNYGDSPEGDKARLLRGRVALDQDDLDVAASMFARVARAEDEALHDDAAYWASKASLRAGAFGDVVEMLDDAIDEYPKSALLPEMRYDRAVALSRAGRRAEAIEGFEAFGAEHDDHTLAADALFYRASLLHEAGRFDESQAALKRFRRNHGDHPRRSDGAFLAAENAYLTGAYDRAERVYADFLEAYPDHADASLAMFRRGMCLDRLDRFDEAEPMLRTAAARAAADPVYRPAVLSLGNGYFAGEQWDEALAMFAAYVGFAADGAANVDDALMKAGLAHGRLRQSDEALAAYDRLLQDYTDSPHRLHAMFERGQLLMEAGASDEATTAFETLLATDPDSRFAPFAYRHLGSLAQRAGDLDRAAVFLAKAAELGGNDFSAGVLVDRAGVLLSLGQYEEAFELASEAVDGSTEASVRARADATRAIALSRLGRHEDALGVMSSIGGRARAAMPRATRDSLVYEEARCLRATGSDTDARERYTTIIDADKEPRLVVHAMLEVAGMDMESGRHGLAGQRLEDVVDRLETIGGVDSNPALAEHATYRLGVCAYETARFADAVAALETFSETYPQSDLGPSADLMCGQSMMELGRYASAIAPLERASSPEVDDDIATAALLRLGEAQAALQYWADSEATYASYLDRYGTQELWFHARFGLAWAKENQARRAEAIDEYRKIVADHDGPTAARAQFQIGECLYADRKYDEAIRELLRVDILYAYDEWSAAALYEAGRCFEESRRPAEAVVQFREVVERFGDTNWGRMAAERLRILTPDGVPGHRQD